MKLFSLSVALCALVLPLTLLMGSRAEGSLLVDRQAERPVVAAHAKPAAVHTLRQYAAR